MRHFFAFAAAALIFTACTAPQPETTTEEVAVLNYYGDTITADGAVPAPEFVALMAGKDSLEVKLEANIIQTCRMKGCWMTVDLGNGEELRVRFKDYGFFVPTEGADGKTVIMEGYAYNDTVSVDDLRHLAEDAGKTEEEILAINEPEFGINFEAHGVIIKD